MTKKTKSEIMLEHANRKLVEEVLRERGIGCGVKFRVYGGIIQLEDTTDNHDEKEITCGVNGYCSKCEHEKESIEIAIQKTKQECGKRKIKSFLKLRKEGIQFVERVLKEKWKPHRAMDVVDCFLVQMIDHFKKERNDFVEKIEEERKIWSHRVKQAQMQKNYGDEGLYREHVDALDDVLMFLKEKKK